MPTYEYVCQDCGHAFERFQTITARPVKACPKCGKSKAKRLIGTGAGIIFKGSGFYQTDYRSESYKKAAESEKKGTEKDTAKENSKAEAKESKSDRKTTSSSKGKEKTA